MDMRLRAAQLSDIPQITALFKEAISDMCLRGIHQWDEIYPSCELLRSDVEKRQMYVLVCEGVIVSAVVINDEQDEEYKSAQWKYTKANAAVIHRLCVHPSHQGRGYGRASVTEAERLMKSMGYTAVRLDAFSQNPFALKLYERLGYERAGEVRFRKGIFFLYEKLL